ncbi:hypothetical protein FPQ18DRAFT_301177 [Pyronema domesticum]|nr:hypothetical protein FPQ18DRAFT_301177 [Pyronema domesticum]
MPAEMPVIQASDSTSSTTPWPSRTVVYDSDDDISLSSFDSSYWDSNGSPARMDEDTSRSSIGSVGFIGSGSFPSLGGLPGVSGVSGVSRDSRDSKETTNPSHHALRDGHNYDYIDLTGDDDDADDQDNTTAMDLSLDTAAATSTAVTVDPEVKLDDHAWSSYKSDTGEATGMIGKATSRPGCALVSIPTAATAYPNTTDMNTKNDVQDDPAPVPLDTAPVDTGNITDLERRLEENTTHQEMAAKTKAAAAKVTKPRDKAAKLRKELEEGSLKEKEEEAKYKEMSTQKPPPKQGRGRPKKAMVNVEEKEKEKDSRRVDQVQIMDARLRTRKRGHEPDAETPGQEPAEPERPPEKKVRRSTRRVRMTKESSTSSSQKERDTTGSEPSVNKGWSSSESESEDESARDVDTTGPDFWRLLYPPRPMIPLEVKLATCNGFLTRRTRLAESELKEARKKIAEFDDSRLHYLSLIRNAERERDLLRVVVDEFMGVEQEEEVPNSIVRSILMDRLGNLQKEEVIVMLYHARMKTRDVSANLERTQRELERTQRELEAARLLNTLGEEYLVDQNSDAEGEEYLLDQDLEAEVEI